MLSFLYSQVMSAVVFAQIASDSGLQYYNIPALSDYINIRTDGIIARMERRKKENNR